MHDELWRGLSYFSKEEFSEPERMSYRLLVRLDDARRFSGVPFVITSSFRDDVDSAHADGVAVDVLASSSWERYQIVNAALRCGFRRMGVYRSHVHLDIARDRPAPVLWHGVQMGVTDAQEEEDEPEAVS